MERNYSVEIDELKKDIAEIKEMLCNSKEKEKIIEEKIQSSFDPEMQDRMSELIKWAKETDNELGVVSYHGFLELGGRESYWDTEHCCVKNLMKIPSDKISMVLSSLGNQQRWEMLLALLKKPMTVAQIVEMFDMKTSGKAYHHLNNLIAADLLEEVKDAEKGTYAVKGHRVQGIIMVMAGVADLINTNYSTKEGEWNL